jgi:NADPH2:quinone reductase
MLYSLVDEQIQQAKILEECANFIDQGSLKIKVSNQFPLEEAAAAHKLLESGSLTGKIVLVMP